jgi:hypothetical protein
MPSWTTRRKASLLMKRLAKSGLGNMSIVDA